MSVEYRIELVGNQFIVVDPWDEIVDRYPTENAARDNIERCKAEDAMWETAQTLYHNADSISPIGWGK